MKHQTVASRRSLYFEKVSCPVGSAKIVFKIVAFVHNLRFKGYRVLSIKEVILHRMRPRGNRDSHKEHKQHMATCSASQLAFAARTKATLHE